MKRLSLILVAIAGYLHTLTAQDSVFVIARLVNTQVVQQDSAIVISTYGHFPSGIYEQDGIIVSLEPFTFLFADSASTSIPRLSAIEGLHVYPNPARDITFLKRQDVKGTFDIRIYNADGQVVEELQWPDGAESIELILDRYVQGLFFLSVTDENLTKASHFKMVKQ